MLITKWDYYTRQEEFKKLADEYTYLAENKKSNIIVNCSSCYKEDNALNFKSSLVLKNIEGYNLLICDSCLQEELKKREEYKKNKYKVRRCGDPNLQSSKASQYV